MASAHLDYEPCCGFGHVHDIVSAWIQSHLGAYMFVNMVNITIPVSYDSILVRSLFF